MRAGAALLARASLALLGLIVLHGPAAPSPATAQVAEASVRAQPVDRPGRSFRHAPHLATIACGDCHLPEERHRAVRVWTPPDCAACHHAEVPVGGCTTCHERGGPPGPRAITMVLDLPVWDAPRERELVFEHDRHEAVGCLECHRAGMERPPAECGACHADHHDAAADCTTCHHAPAVDTHDLQAHVGCDGCHTGAPALPASRPACLVCHEEQRTHRVEEVCVRCHALPTVPEAETP